MTPDIEPTKRMIAEVLRLRLEDHISHYELGRSLDVNTVLTSRCDDLARKWVIAIEAKLLGKTHEVELFLHSVPATNWDLWLVTFLPAWVLRRWPAKYRDIRRPCRVSMCCPHHGSAIHDDMRHIEFMLSIPSPKVLEALCSRDSSSASASGSAGNSCPSPSPGASPSTSARPSIWRAWLATTRGIAASIIAWCRRSG